MKNISAWRSGTRYRPWCCSSCCCSWAWWRSYGCPSLLTLTSHSARSRTGFAAWSCTQEIETQVLQKIEGSVAGVGNIHNITSLAIEGTASIWIEFQIGTPIDRAVADVRDAVAKVRSNLPAGIQEPIVQRVDVDGGSIAYYAVATTSETQEQISWFVDNTVTKRLLASPVSPRCGAAAVSTAKSASSSILRACRPSASLLWT